MAQNLMFVNEEVKFKETQIALGYSGKLLDIFKYVDVVKFEIDTFMLDKFWQCISESSRTSLCAAVINWLGYDSKQERNNKSAFVQLLDSNNIEFTQIGYKDSNFSIS